MFMRSHTHNEKIDDKKLLQFKCNGRRRHSRRSRCELPRVILLIGLVLRPLKSFLQIKGQNSMEKAEQQCTIVFTEEGEK